MGVWTKTGSHHRLQSAYLSHGATLILSSALYYRTLGTQDKKKNCFCVDDFGVKYFSKDDANNLLDSLKQNYEISTDWYGRKYIGLTIDWNYSKENVDISIPEYMSTALDRLLYPKPKRLQYSPYRWSVPDYLKKTPNGTISRREQYS